MSGGLDARRVRELKRQIVSKRRSARCLETGQRRVVPSVAQLEAADKLRQEADAAWKRLRASW